MQEKNKNLLDNLDTKIKNVEKNLTDNLNANTNTKYKEYSSGIKILATMPVFLLIGIFLGGISGIYTIWKKNIYDKIK